MEPFSLAIMAAIGIGTSIYGASQSVKNSKNLSQTSQQITGMELQAEQKRYQAMQLDAQRKQMEVFRNQQRARSLALNSANNQGANFGSGLQGGYGQIAGATNWNIQGIQQNLGIGQDMFGINSQISQLKMQQASIQGKQATAQGITAIGNSIVGALPAAKGLFGGFNLSSPATTATPPQYTNPANPSGTGIW